MDPRAVVRCLIAVGQRLPDDIRRDILALAGDAVPSLIEILDDDELALSSTRGGGWAPVHAARLLGELRAAGAVERMLRRLAATDWMDILHDQLIQALPTIGAPVIEPALRAFAGSTDPDVRSSLVAVLAKVGVHDDRIFEILIGDLRVDPSRAAGNLAEYGDPRAVPHLHEALDQYEIVDSENPFANQALIELRAAIEDLGGTLNMEQLLKCRRGEEAGDNFRRRLHALIEDRRHDVVPSEPVGRPHRPVRNEPCWCGSTRKYKKCHLATDENGTRNEMG